MDQWEAARQLTISAIQSRKPRAVAAGQLGGTAEGGGRQRGRQRLVAAICRGKHAGQHTLQTREQTGVQTKGEWLPWSALDGKTWGAQGVRGQTNHTGKSLEAARPQEGWA